MVHDTYTVPSPLSLSTVHTIPSGIKEGWELSRIRIVPAAQRLVGIVPSFPSFRASVFDAGHVVGFDQTQCFGVHTISDFVVEPYLHIAWRFLDNNCGFGTDRKMVR